MKVVRIPCLADNYAWLLVGDGACAVVDPSEDGPVRAALAEVEVPLKAILATHHHHDHVGGIASLVESFAVPVYAHAHDQGRTPCLTHPLAHGDHIELPGGLSFDILHVPGHTLGAIAFVGHGWAFTGDTLFTGGCGRLFEGTPEQMVVSLNEVLGALPDETQIACGHEYTESNLRFAAHVEPADPNIAARLDRVRAARAAGQATVPAPLSEERLTNPFLRVTQESVKAHVGRKHGAPAEVLAAIRDEKNSFR